jgi:thymidylate kinase
MSSIKTFTVALIGPDGTGKSTIGRKLERISPLPAKYVYMGVNLESSNLVLPTTRLLLEVKRARGQRPDITVPRELSQPRTRQSLRKRFTAGLRATLRLVNLAAEEWFRQLIVWYYEIRGYCVILDRHFYFDYYAHDIANEDPKRTLNSRIHGFMLQKLYPKPDFVIFLDAPSEVLFSRKPEGTLDARERRRQEYVQLHDVAKTYAVVDVSRPEEEVMREVSELIMKFYCDKNEKPCQAASTSG